jgi:hypothetical protein
MLDKLGILFLCERCDRPVHEDDHGFDGENNLCATCVDEWTEKQARYWRPLYDAEVAAGIHDPKGEIE